MNFEEEFLQQEIISDKRKKEFLEDSYPQKWLAEEYIRKKKQIEI